MQTRWRLQRVRFKHLPITISVRADADCTQKAQQQGEIPRTPIRPEVDLVRIDLDFFRI